MSELLSIISDYVLHLDRVLPRLLENHGLWVYAILFVIVFAETGFVITPFLPGDSLLFAAGAVAATTGRLEPAWIILILSVAAILGDTVNYSIGHFVGPKIFSKPKSFLFNPDHLNQAHRFYEKYGGKTIIIARFVPIIRTFAPFVAGIGSMTYWRFLLYNVVGGIGWVASLTCAGYWFGNRDFVKRNFSMVILAIIVISVMPAVIEFIRGYRQRRQARGDAS
jgi:membrane-associated protein